STDWFNSPRREAERLREVIAARLQELKTREFEFAATAAPQRTEISQPTEGREVVVTTTPSNQERPPRQDATSESQKRGDGVRIAIGDTVRIKYVTDDRKTLQITISRAKSDPSHGIIHFETPVAQALLGAEVGDEVEVLVGSYVRRAIVERIIKG